MKQFLKIKMFSVCLLVCLTLLLSLCLVKPTKIANAISDTSLNVTDLSNENAKTIRYSNVSNYIKNSKSLDSLCKNVGLTANEIENLGVETICNAEQIIVQDMTMLVTLNDNGEVMSVVSANPQTEGNYPDIPNNKGYTGYMSGRIIMVQDPALNKVERSSSGTITKFISYGFKCSISMSWKKDPAYRMRDVFTFYGRDGGVYTEQDATCDVFAWQSTTTSMGTSTQGVSINNSKYYSSGWPAFTFNLPNNLSGIGSSTRFSGIRLTSTATVFANDDFNFMFGYAHKQWVVGNISVSYPGSISFSCGTSFRSFNSPNLHVDVIKDSELEALKQ